ncbi:MAG: spore coat protein CotJB [Clostridia bacterium]|nr:spore coat protein CotJB [Clostridia bacterium]MBQ9848248.1 spore coat protein CotJB [Clostridia bacterium]
MMGDNRRETLMRQIQRSCFVAHECALYLDCHPNNRKALEKRAQALKEKQEAVARYQELYGPLTVEAAGGNEWNWIKGKWPWQREEN